MEQIEHELEEAVAQLKIPGVILAFATNNERKRYFKTFGHTSLQPGSAPLSSDSTLCLASCTKLVTSVAAMQCVESGLISLDDDISKFLPEWRDAMILTGFNPEDGGAPILERASNAITLAQLLSHTSGITGLENEKIMRFYSAMGSSKATLLQRYFMSDDQEEAQKIVPEIREIMGKLVVEPLIFEPGTGWAYGQGTDWAGQLIERLTHKTLEDYCQERIFQPLGMRDTTYRLLKHPHVAKNLVKLTTQSKDETIKETESILPIDPEMDLGGSNLYSSAPDFMALLQSLLKNDGKVLKPETVDLMLGYRLQDPAVLEQGFWEEIKDGMKLDHCLAGLVLAKDAGSGSKAGTVTWQGATKCYWWIDRAGGVCGFYGSQIIGMHNRVSAKMYDMFMKAVYASLEQ